MHKLLPLAYILCNALQQLLIRLEDSQLLQLSPHFLWENICSWVINLRVRLLISHQQSSEEVLEQGLVNCLLPLLLFLLGFSLIDGRGVV